MRRGFLDKPSPAALEAVKKKAQDEAEGRADILVLMESPDSNVFRLRLSSMKKAPKVPKAARKALASARAERVERSLSARKVERDESAASRRSTRHRELGRKRLAACRGIASSAL